MTSRVFGFVDTFIGNNGTVDSRQLAQFISDVKDMAKTETITFVEGINHLAACCICQLITVSLNQHFDSCFD